MCRIQCVAFNVSHVLVIRLCREEVVERMNGTVDGTFLVRRATTHGTRGDYTLTLRYTDYFYYLRPLHMFRNASAEQTRIFSYDTLCLYLPTAFLTDDNFIHFLKMNLGQTPSV